jgi:3-deoxy-manno-octulosonate cytidylyltransferase (CMP-KDO synthetase)
MKIAAIVPARMASTRFPGKPLAEILGLPMIEHVRRRVALCRSISEVVVATCDEEIRDCVFRYGGRSVLTSSAHERCTDRVAEAAEQITADVIVNVQGDEPFVRPEMLDLLIAPFQSEPSLLCTNLISEIKSDEEFRNYNVVKTVVDLANNAVYFSREAIPSASKAGTIVFGKYKQLGIIAFQKAFLIRFARLSPTPLEQVESIDMLRAIEHGFPVRTVRSPWGSIGVDTPADLERAIDLMKHDDLAEQYMRLTQA